MHQVLLAVLFPIVQRGQKLATSSTLKVPLVKESP